jgi:hypothetical protein
MITSVAPRRQTLILHNKSTLLVIARSANPLHVQHRRFEYRCYDIDKLIGIRLLAAFQKKEQRTDERTSGEVTPIVILLSVLLGRARVISMLSGKVHRTLTLPKVGIQNTTVP